MRSAHTNRRSRAQRARRDSEAEAAPRLGTPVIAHGTEVGEITIRFHGQVVTATLLQAGEKCRTLGVRFDGEPIQLMGLYEAAVAASRRIARVPSQRSDFWNT